MFSQVPFSWHASKLPVIVENVLAVPSWHFCVGSVRRNREFALCCNHSFKKWFLRWSCFLRAKQWGFSKISKGENSKSYKMAFKKYLFKTFTIWAIACCEQTYVLRVIPLPSNASLLEPQMLSGRLSWLVLGALWVEDSREARSRKEEWWPNHSCLLLHDTYQPW